MRRAVLLLAAAGCVACQAANPAYYLEADAAAHRDDAGDVVPPGAFDGAIDRAVPPPDGAAPPPDASAPPVSVGGLKGEYFDTMTFATLKLTRVDPQIDFDWKFGAPAPGIDGETFSVRWTGAIRAPTSESYTIYADSDDGVRVIVDGTLVLEDWRDHATLEVVGHFSFEAGRAYPVKIEYFENTGDADIRLSWSTASRPKQLIPAAALSP